MSNVNWHAYLDHSLSTEERDVAEQILAQSPEARARLENLRAFIATVRESSLSEDVPLGALQAQLRSVKPKPSFFRSAWKPTLAACTAVALFATIYFNRPVSEGHIAVQSFDEASRWMQEANGLILPKIQLAGAQLVGSERTKDSGCFCMMIDGKMIHLKYSKDLKCRTGMERCVLEGCDFLKKPGCAAFEKDGVVWMVEGEDEALIWTVARAASKDIRST